MSSVTFNRYFSLIALFLSLSAHASFRHVASIAAGADIVTVHMNQNITLISPFQNTYVSNNHIEDFVGGLFIGVENPIYGNVLGQIGVSYYQNNGYEAQGLVYQFADPSMGNLYYQYNITSQRILAESKVLLSYQEKYHPFINLGVGEAINTASQYREVPVTSASVPMFPGFNDRTTHSFAYLIGIGVDMDVSANMRLGAMYRYVNLGQAQLSTTSIQESNDTLKNNPFYASEILLQLSYLG